MNNNDIINLLFSPQWTGKLLHHFLVGACSSKKKAIKFELIYFALPFIYNKKILIKLINSKSSSSFSTTFKDIELKNCLIEKNNQVKAFRDITNQALIYLGNKIELNIDSSIQVKDLVDYKKEETLIIKDYCKAAYYWGLMLAKEDYRNVFAKIGVSKI